MKDIIDRLRPHLTLMGWAEAPAENRRPQNGEWKAYPIGTRVDLLDEGVTLPISLVIQGDPGFAFIAIRDQEGPEWNPAPHPSNKKWLPSSLKVSEYSTTAMVRMPNEVWYSVSGPIRFAIAGPEISDVLSELIRTTHILERKESKVW